MLALTILISLQSFANAAQFHVEISDQCHTVLESCHDEASQVASSEPNGPTHSEDSDCCHVHCCVSNLTTEPKFENLFRLIIEANSVVQNVRLNNYHNSLYRPPIA